MESWAWRPSRTVLYPPERLLIITLPLKSGRGQYGLPGIRVEVDAERIEAILTAGVVVVVRPMTSAANLYIQEEGRLVRMANVDPSLTQWEKLFGEIRVGDERFFVSSDDLIKRAFSSYAKKRMKKRTLREILAALGEGRRTEAMAKYLASELK